MDWCTERTVSGLSGCRMNAGCNLEAVVNRGVRDAWQVCATVRLLIGVRARRVRAARSCSDRELSKLPAENRQ